MKLFGWFSPSAVRALEHEAERSLYLLERDMRRIAVEAARRAYNVGFDTGLAVGRAEAQRRILDAFWKRAGIKRPEKVH